MRSCRRFLEVDDMPLKNRDCWIFDMDGTLTNAVHDFDVIRLELGLPAGQPILEAIAELPADESVKLQAQLNTIEMEIAHMATPQPGAHDLLKSVKRNGYQLGILTRNGEAIARVTLAACGLLEYFDDEAIVGRESCAPKPDPSGVTYLLQHWGAGAGQAVMVGDYLFDLQAGKQAGASTVHFDVDGFFPWPEWTDLGVKSLFELNSHLCCSAR